MSEEVFLKICFEGSYGYKLVKKKTKKGGAENQGKKLELTKSES